MDKINQYLTYGVPDYLATKLEALEISVSVAKKLPQKTLINQFFLTKEEVSLVKRFVTRNPIREDVGMLPLNCWKTAILHVVYVKEKKVI